MDTSIPAVVRLVGTHFCEHLTERRETVADHHTDKFCYGYAGSGDQPFFASRAP